MSAMTTSIQYHTNGLSQCNRTGNRLQREREKLSSLLPVQ